MQATAQVTVEAKLDSVTILIGEQTGIQLSVTMKEGQEAQFPAFNPRQELTPGVEVLETTDCDTTHLNNGMVRLARKYTITSFDDTLYYIPPINVKGGGKN